MRTSDSLGDSIAGRALPGVATAGDRDGMKGTEQGSEWLSKLYLGAVSGAFRAT